MAEHVIHLVSFLKSEAMTTPRTMTSASLGGLLACSTVQNCQCNCSELHAEETELESQHTAS